MTRREAQAEFKAEILPYIRAMYETDGRVDGPARREEWCNYTDRLREDGRITRRQDDTWSNPF